MEIIFSYIIENKYFSEIVSNFHFLYFSPFSYCYITNTVERNLIANKIF